MPKATGLEIYAAFKKLAAWGTALACGAGDGVLILPHSLTMDRPNRLDDSQGVIFPTYADQGLVAVTGDVPLYMRYDGIDLLIALAMGASGGAPSQQGGTAAYTQSFTLADNLDGLFAVLAIQNNINIDEFTSVKIKGFTISGDIGEGPLKITLHCIGDTRNPDSAINTSVTFANVTVGESQNRILMHQSVFRINDQDGAGLASPGDVITPSSFELAYDRPMSGVYASGTDKNAIDEPTGEALPTVKLTLTIPRYTTKDYFVDWLAETNKKADIVFTGGQIEAPYDREFTLQFPNLAYMKPEVPQAAGILQHVLEFDCLGALAAPTGMSGITKPFQVNVQNQRTTDVLA
jgi:hypothetical protein